MLYKEENMKKFLIIALCFFVELGCSVHAVAVSNSGCPEAKALFIKKTEELKNLLKKNHDGNITNTAEIVRLQKVVDLCREEKIVLCKYRTIFEKLNDGLSDMWNSIAHYLPWHKG
jgi:hypothetical protein